MIWILSIFKIEPLLKRKRAVSASKQDAESVLISITLREVNELALMSYYQDNPDTNKCFSPSCS